jgi:hypothetical protein
MEVSGWLHTLATLPPGKESLVPNGWEVVKRKILSPSRLESLIIQPVAQSYTTELSQNI